MYPKGICSASQIKDLGRRWQGKLAAVRLTDEVFLRGEYYCSRARQTILSKTVESETDRSEKVLFRQRGEEKAPHPASLRSATFPSRGRLLQPSAAVNTFRANSEGVSEKSFHRASEAEESTPHPSRQAAPPSPRTARAFAPPAKSKIWGVAGRGRQLQPSEAEKSTTHWEGLFSKKTCKTATSAGDTPAILEA